MDFNGLTMESLTSNTKVEAYALKRMNIKECKEFYGSLLYSQLKLYSVPRFLEHI